MASSPNPLVICSMMKALDTSRELVGRPDLVKEASHQRKPKRVFLTIRLFWRVNWMIDSSAVRYRALSGTADIYESKQADMVSRLVS